MINPPLPTTLAPSLPHTWEYSLLVCLRPDLGAVGRTIKPQRNIFLIRQKSAAPVLNTMYVGKQTQGSRLGSTRYIPYITYRYVHT